MAKKQQAHKNTIKLSPEIASSSTVTLTPETPVLCINRGREPLTGNFQGKDYPIPVGYFTCPYVAAEHFKARAVVPGSRTASEASFIAILGVPTPVHGGFKILKTIDARREWEPFTDKECREFRKSAHRDAMAKKKVADRDLSDEEITALQGDAITYEGESLDSAVCELSELLRETKTPEDFALIATIADRVGRHLHDVCILAHYHIQRSKQRAAAASVSA